MSTALIRQESGVVAAGCSIRELPTVPWQQYLPSSLAALAVAPVHFKVSHEYEMVADCTKGYDHHNDPCYCAFRYVRTRLRSDDDQVFYQEEEYAETLTSWKLEDERWLVFREIIAGFDQDHIRSHLALSETMPR